MGAGMRLGWLVAPREVMDHLGVLKVDGGTNIFGSYVAAEWIPNNLPSHLVTLREIYHRRKLLMLDALDKHMPPGTTWTDPEGGFFVWVTLPEGIDTLEMLPQRPRDGHRVHARQQLLRRRRRRKPDAALVLVCE